MIKFLKTLKNIVSPDYWASKIGEKSGLYDKARAYGKKDKPWYIKVLLVILILVLLFFVSELEADDNHVHVDQVQSGDNFELGIDQIGYENLIKFSFNHDDNTVNILQSGNNMYIGYTDAWGSGYSWGGDLDGLRNDVDIRQKCSLTSCNETDFQFHSGCTRQFHFNFQFQFTKKKFHISE